MRLLKGLAWLLLIALSVLVVAFGWGRSRPPTAREQRALAALGRDLKPTSGRNAYPALWFIGFDVPIDQTDAAYSVLRQRLQSSMTSAGTAGDPRVQLMAGVSPLPLVSADEWEVLCGGREDDCIDKVQAHVGDVRSLLVKHAALLDQERNLAQFDYVWSDLPGVPLLLTQPFGFTTGLWHSAIAADFAEGREAAAMDAVCTQVAAMRRLHARTNSLAASGVFIGHAHGSVHLFAQLLSKFPVDQPLPASCDVAFAPVRAEDVDICPAMQEQFREFQAMPWVAVHWYDHLTWSKEQTHRLYAAAYGTACDPELPAKLLTDEPIDAVVTSPQPDLFSLVSNRDGVRLSRIPASIIEPNLAEQQDFAATLRMGALILWLRNAPGQHMTLQERINQRPVWMSFADDRKFALEAGGNALRMEPRTHNIKPWMTSWPLPQGL